MQPNRPVPVEHLADFLAAMKDQWPADQNEAYRAVAHHVLMAIYDVNAGDAHSGAAK